MRNRNGSIGLGFSPFYNNKRVLALAENYITTHTNYIIQKNA